MADIQLSSNNDNDIYSVGFDKNLNRETPSIQSPVVYDSVDNNLPSQNTNFAGGFVAGTNNTIVVVDPKMGIWLGNKDYASAPFRVSMSGELYASSFSLAGVAVQTQGTFGGDGTDGALAITSGTTTVNLGSAQVVVKNYSSISITGTGKLAFSNPNGSGTIIILKSQGNVTLTSSDTAMIDTRAMGAAGGVGGSTKSASGASGETACGLWSPTFSPGIFGAVGTAGAGAGGAASTAAQLDPWLTGSGNDYKMHRRSLFVTPGSGGGGGAAGGGGVNTDWVAGARGGAGGGALILECAGALNFTTGSIDISGEDGATAVAGTGTASTSISGGGGGGGGGAGMALILYNTLTANTGTIIAKGGTGGAGSAITSLSNNGSPDTGSGGGGAAAYGGAGTAGANGVAPSGVVGGGVNSANGTFSGAGTGGGSGAGGDANSGSAGGGVGGTPFATSVTQIIVKNTFFS